MEFDPSAVLDHRRVRALGPAAQGVYVRLLAQSSWCGWLDERTVARAFAPLGHGARACLDELADAGLLDELPDNAGYQVVPPRVFDDAAVFPGAGARAAWAADARAAAARAGAALGALDARAWAGLVDAVARGRAGAAR